MTIKTGKIICLKINKVKGERVVGRYFLFVDSTEIRLLLLYF